MVNSVQSLLEMFVSNKRELLFDAEVPALCFESIISGKALFFKSIEEQQHETRTEYHEVSDDLTPQDAVAILVRMEEQPNRCAARN